MTDSAKARRNIENWKLHRWSGWPGAFCLDCGIEDPAEIELADGKEDGEYYCPPCLKGKVVTQ